MNTLKIAAAAVAAFTSLAGAAMAQESFTNQELSDLISERGKPYVISKLRNKTITVTGELDRFSDTSIGSTVAAYMDIPGGGGGYAVSCEFKRDDTETYDRMAQLETGAQVTFTGKFKDINTSFIQVYLSPCMPQ
jgi:hypothetical protein